MTLSVAAWMAMGRATHVLGLDRSCPLPGQDGIAHADAL